MLLLLANPTGIVSLFLFQKKYAPHYDAAALYIFGRECALDTQMSYHHAAADADAVPIVHPYLVGDTVKLTDDSGELSFYSYDVKPGVTAGQYLGGTMYVLGVHSTAHGHIYDLGQTYDETVLRVFQEAIVRKLQDTTPRVVASIKRRHNGSAPLATLERERMDVLGRIQSHTAAHGSLVRTRGDQGRFAASHGSLHDRHDDVQEDVVEARAFSQPVLSRRAEAALGLGLQSNPKIHDRYHTSSRFHRSYDERLTPGNPTRRAEYDPRFPRPKDAEYAAADAAEPLEFEEEDSPRASRR